MILTEELTELEELYFQLAYGSLFAISINVEYSDAMAIMLTDTKDKYLLNKIKEAQKASDTVKKLLMTKIFKGFNEEQVGIAKEALSEHHKLAYDIFGLDNQDQLRVKNLISKIKREKQ